LRDSLGERVSLPTAPGRRPKAVMESKPSGSRSGQDKPVRPQNPSSDSHISRPRERRVAVQRVTPFASARVAVCILLAVIPLLAGCGPEVVEDVTLMRKVAVALNKAKVDVAVHDVMARTDSSIAITLNATTEDMGSEARAQNAAKGIADLVFDQVPEVKKVSVFDGNDQIVDVLSRKTD
jgi:hypothetical protein